MFYGRSDGNGNIISSANSNNFTLSGGGGTITITLNQWTYYAPLFTIVPSLYASNSAAITCTHDISRGHTSDPWQVTVRTNDASGDLSARNISFRGRSGMTRVFTAANLTLTPEIIDFQGSKVLALSTTIGAETVYLDKGTVLIGVGRSMKLQLSETSVSDGSGNTWSLTGWTYGGGSGPNGKAWSTNDGGNTVKPYFTLTTDPAGSGPATTLYSFAIKGVRSAGSGQQYISSDPIVRLSSVPPAGISLS